LTNPSPARRPAERGPGTAHARGATANNPHRSNTRRTSPNRSMSDNWTVAIQHHRSAGPQPGPNSADANVSFFNFLDAAAQGSADSATNAAQGNSTTTTSGRRATRPRNDGTSPRRSARLMQSLGERH
jgi:hypothetical protein